MIHLFPPVALLTAKPRLCKTAAHVRRFAKTRFASDQAQSLAFVKSFAARTNFKRKEQYLARAYKKVPVAPGSAAGRERPLRLREGACLFSCDSV